MTNLNLLTNSRKYVRKLVTDAFNGIEGLSTLPTHERFAYKSTFLDYNARLTKLNEDIQSLKFDTNTTEAQLNEELKTCEEYSSKLRMLLSRVEFHNSISTTRNLVNDDSSFLRSPKAPLPTFKSGEGEDLK